MSSLALCAGTIAPEPLRRNHCAGTIALEFVRNSWRTGTSGDPFGLTALRNRIKKGIIEGILALEKCEVTRAVRRP